MSTPTITLAQKPLPKKIFTQFFGTLYISVNLGTHAAPSAPSNFVAAAYNSTLEISHARAPQRACKFFKIGLLLEGKRKGQKIFWENFLTPLYKSCGYFMLILSVKI